MYAIVQAVDPVIDPIVAQFGILAASVTAAFVAVGIIILGVRFAKNIITKFGPSLLNRLS